MLDDASAVPTFIQNRMVPEDIAETALKYMTTGSLERSRAIEAFKRFREAVGNPNAPTEAAARILDMIVAD